MKPKIILLRSISDGSVRVFETLSGAAEHLGVDKSSVSRAAVAGRVCNGHIPEWKRRVLLVKTGSGGLELCVPGVKGFVTRDGTVLKGGEWLDISGDFYRDGGFSSEIVNVVGDMDRLESMVECIYDKVCAK